MWRMNVRSPSSSGRISDSSCCPMSGYGCSGTQAPVSARKLANALWEMSRNSSSLELEKLQGKIAKWEKSRDYNLRRPIEVISQPQRPSNEGHCPVLLKSEKAWCSSHRRRILKKSGLEGLSDRTLDCFSCGSLMEGEFHSQSFIPGESLMSAKGHLKDLRNALLTSKELLKILSRFWEPAEQHNLPFTVFSAIRTEVEQAIFNVDQLFQEQRSICSELNCLKEKLVFEIQMFKNKERERFSLSLQSIMKELQSEKKLSRRVKRLNEKLAMELAETRASLLQAGNELASERRSREILEHVCDELAKGIGGEKAEVEEMKRDSTNVLENLEKEREMLQLADEWREDWVQMNLSEAKHQFEEKNAAVNQLRNELEAFLTNGMGSGVGKGRDAPARDSEHEEERTVCPSKRDAPARDLEHEEERTVCPSKVDETVEDEEKESTGELSEDCDLHSIELNMDSKSRSFNWSYATGSTVFGRSFEESNEGGSENSDKEFKSNGDVKEESSRKNSLVFSRDWRQGRLSKSNASIDEDAERYISVKELRDRLLAGSRINLPPGMRGPCRQWSRSTNQQQGRLKGFHDSEERLCEGLKVADLVKKLERDQK
ncbi:LOW QUALITY PROTEIN: uncharacterized protein At5g41620-like [Phalaenopsis equestris]|uniref:LOW QUALITY PROTEIN: uncharacterized protein At5g41620-like n=1 Tax=Phalaenopsis equestris TaxID=78828 RepID=UPI0009E282F0|nr:LOW QUALITY PROTEIN: uncharacterized protein At5g41620-like [Phalaenopsis equestris]